MGVANSPIPKQQMTENTDAEPQLIPDRDAPWYDDGSVVLQAELKQFRVHRSILSMNSVIFKDMFSLAQPSAEGEVVDGCPVIHLSDSATDLRYVLEAFYNGRNYSPHKLPETFAVVAAFLRLGKKYEITKLYEEALSRLCNDYPPNLAQWERRERNGASIKYYAGVHFDVVNLAREIDIPSLLPTAFYYICASPHPLDCITKGFTHMDGTSSIKSIEDKMICLVGRQKLITKQACQTLGWMDYAEDSEIAANCHQWSRCETARKKLWFDMSHPTISHYPLNKWNTCFEKDLCAPCIQSSKVTHTKGRVSVWNELPSLFELPDWGELLKQ
jgi:hypothetical protein